VLTALPCGGLGELDPDPATGMQIACKLHREFPKDPATGLYILATSPHPDARSHGAHGGHGEREEKLFQYRDRPSCGAVTDLVQGGIRVVVSTPDSP
jgi:hypothetical protein